MLNGKILVIKMFSLLLSFFIYSLNKERAKNMPITTTTSDNK